MVSSLYLGKKNTSGESKMRLFIVGNSSYYVFKTRLDYRFLKAVLAARVAALVSLRHVQSG